MTQREIKTRISKLRKEATRLQIAGKFNKSSKLTQRIMELEKLLK